MSSFTSAPTASSNSVRIEHLHSHFHTPEPLAPGALQAWHEAFAQGNALDLQALAGQWVGPDEWLLIRRLDLAVGWRQDTASHEVARQWLQVLQGAVMQVASQPAHSGVVRYRSRREGLSDLMYRSALGETSRQWAWQRMGLIARAGVPASDALATGLRQLLGEAGWVWPTVCQWVVAEPQTAALSAMLRALPEAGWQQLLMAATPSRAYAQVMAQRGQRGLMPLAGSDGVDRDGPHGEGDAPKALPQGLGTDATGHPALASSLIDWLRRRPHLAARHGDTLAVLLAAVAWPDQGNGEAVLIRRLASAWQQVRASAAASVRPAEGHGAQGPLPAPQQPEAARGLDDSAAQAQPSVQGHKEVAQSLVDATTSAGSDDKSPTAPALPDQHQWLPTAWAGALFWLRHAGAAEMVAKSFADTATDQRSHALHALASALGVPEGDPVLHAFVGGAWPQGQAHPDLAPQAKAVVDQWRQWLAEQAPDLPEPRLQSLCARPGRLRFEPGWIELHLRLDQADTRIRRLGLDVDPGYLPWLGCVVRICYDD